MIRFYATANHNSGRFDLGEVCELATMCGAYAFNLRSAESAKIAEEVASKTGASLAVVIAYEAGDWDWRIEGMERLASLLYRMRDMPVKRAIIHWEMPKDARGKQPSLSEWQTVIGLVKATWSVPVVGYDHPGNNLGLGYKDGCGPCFPFDRSSCSLYSDNADRCHQALIQSLLTVDGDPGMVRDGVGVWQPMDYLRPLMPWLWPVQFSAVPQRGFYSDETLKYIGPLMGRYHKNGWLDAAYLHPGHADHRIERAVWFREVKRIVEAVG